MAKGVDLGNELHPAGLHKERIQLINEYLDIIYEDTPEATLLLKIRKRAYKYYLEFLFQDVSFVGKSMLDIGGGSGKYSLYGACMGAKNVVLLEPELEGSANKPLDTFQRLSSKFSVNNISALPVSFQNFEPCNQTFDIILLHSSINHLDEEACINLKHSDDAINRYKAIFQKLSQIASPGAKLIICDCSRYNFFALLHLRNPFAPTIEWHKHQSPSLWSNMLQDFGFVNPKIRWTLPGLPKETGKLIGNRFACYFLSSYFYLCMDKP